MRFFLDDLLVGLALLASVFYAVFSLGPRSLRGRLLGGASAVLRRLPGFPGLHELAQRLDTAASIKAKGTLSDAEATIVASSRAVNVDQGQRHMRRLRQLRVGAAANRAIIRA